MTATLKTKTGGWGFSSVVEHLPSKRKALGSVSSSEKKKEKKKKDKNSFSGADNLPTRTHLSQRVSFIPSQKTRENTRDKKKVPGVEPFPTWWI